MAKASEIANNLHDWLRTVAALQSATLALTRTFDLNTV
jgi:hypothetical protein